MNNAIDPQILMWAIGGAFGVIFVLMGVQWSYINNSNSRLVDFVKSVKIEINSQLDKAITMVEDHEKEDRMTHDKFDERYARKENVDDLKIGFNQLRNDMSTQFTAVHSQVGGLSTQIAQIATILTTNSARKE